MVNYEPRKPKSVVSAPVVEPVVVVPEPPVAAPAAVENWRRKLMNFINEWIDRWIGWMNEWMDKELR